ncbi:hypothetical protein K438DRAFT_694150, partial [Mycena galopus ATCC 62051]
SNPSPGKVPSYQNQSPPQHCAPPPGVGPGPDPCSVQPAPLSAPRKSSGPHNNSLPPLRTTICPPPSSSLFFFTRVPFWVPSNIFSPLSLSLLLHSTSPSHRLGFTLPRVVLAHSCVSFSFLFILILTHSSVLDIKFYSYHLVSSSPSLLSRFYASMYPRYLA